VYENPTRNFSSEAVNHVHMLIELPTHRIPPWFVSCFHSLFNRLIYPGYYSHPKYCNPKILVIKRGRLQGDGDHPVYVTKQLIDFDIASDRLFCCDAA